MEEYVRSDNTETSRATLRRIIHDTVGEAIQRLSALRYNPDDGKDWYTSQARCLREIRAMVERGDTGEVGGG